MDYDFIPFKGLCYNPKKIRDLSKVISPPYDVISESERLDLEARDPCNAVRLILGKGNDWHSKAAATLGKWIKEGILTPSERPAFYIYSQTFAEFSGVNNLNSAPESSPKTSPSPKPSPQRGEGEKVPQSTAEFWSKRRRTAIFGLKRLEKLGSGKVLPHETTLSAPKEDRLKLITATKTQLSPIFGIYSDEDGVISGVIKERVAGNVTAGFVTPDGIRHDIWVLDEDEECKKIEDAMNDREILIADGHHRYETVWNYYRSPLTLALSPLGSGGGEGEGYVMMSLVCDDDEGLIILPTHRVIKNRPSFDWNSLKLKLDSVYEVEVVGEIAKAVEDMEKISDSHVTFTVHVPTDGRFYIYKRKKGTSFEDSVPVMSLHKFVFEKFLGIDKEVLAGGKHIEYCKPDVDPLKKLKDVSGQALFMLPAPKIKDIFDVSRAGLRMPQKSTYFYPKIPTGIVFYLL